MNTHKGILIEMKCDHSFEIIHLFTEGILERGEATATFVSSVFYPPDRAKPIPASQVHTLICCQTSCWISFGSRPLLP